jgi:predicted RecA/RadA family phage recombinase
MARYVHEGKTIPYTNPGPGAVAYGDVVNLTTRIGIAGSAMAAGASGNLIMEGVMTEVKAAGVAVAQGALVYWDPVASNITNVAGGNIPAGYCTVAALAGDANITFKLLG